MKLASPAGVWTCLFVSAAFFGCQQHKSNDEAPPPTANEPVPAPVRPRNPLAAEIQAAHDEADAASTPEDQRRSATHLERLLKRTRSGESAVMDEVHDDLASRAARLYFLAGEPAEARRVASEALEARNAPTVGRANLLVVLADAEEALGDRDLARQHLLEALSVNQQLLDRELERP